MPPITAPTNTTDTDEQQRLARAIKFTAPDVIEGLAMPFGFDTDGESFTADTDFCIEWFGKSGRPFLFDHGLDPTLKGAVMGRQTDYEVRDEGVWAQVQLDRNARYRKAIDSLIEQGALGYSSGAMPHLATKNAKGHITRWPWVELSGTPIPAHPGAMNLHYVKSSDAIRHLEEAEIAIPDPLKAALAALDEWAESRDDSGLPDGLKFAEHADRLLVDVEAFRDRVLALAGLRAKSGRVLSAQTRERLTRHPSSLRELADDFDTFLAEADAGKAAKTADLFPEWLAAQGRLARFDRIPISTGDSA